MTFVPNPRARQPVRERWPLVRLVEERAIALGYAIDRSTQASYSSAFESYLTFCTRHEFPIEPTPDTLSFYIVYMSHFIRPASVSSYLSGIVDQLEPWFPDVRSTRSLPLVKRTLAGMKKLRGSPQRRRMPLTASHILHIITSLRASVHHDDKLFLAQLTTGWNALMRTAELTMPDAVDKRDSRKVSKRATVLLSATEYGFTLPGHKADRFFEGNRILIHATDTLINPYTIFSDYLCSRDHHFPYHDALWLRADGSVPTYSWFIRRLSSFFNTDDNIGGQSLRAGGATMLAEAGVSLDIIQALGRWSSDAFRVYIRRHPLLLFAIINARTSH